MRCSVAFGQVLVLGFILGATPSAVSQLRPDPDDLARAPAELLDRLRANPIDYFRFVNRPWIGRVCAVFAAEIAAMPIVRLHGDAHLEQFAVTNDAWGLDDFDDSARGPALVDVVRYLGSIDLTLRRRGWSRDRKALGDTFFAGYRRGLAEPDFRPPPPAVVNRLRAQTPQARDAFLAWGEAQMAPMTEASTAAVVAGLDAISRVIYTERPDLPRDYFTVARAGWLRVGIGSALTAKILIRVQGPSAAPDDDELIEAKELRQLGGLSCLEAAPPALPALRVIVGTKQVGRLKHNVLAAGPDLVIPEVMVQGRQMQNWWIRSWDASYRELRIDDIRSVSELKEIVYDAGVQLGGGALRDEAGLPDGANRRRELESLARLEPRIKDETSRLIEQLMLGWQELRRRGPAPTSPPR